MVNKIYITIKLTNPCTKPEPDILKKSSTNKAVPEVPIRLQYKTSIN